MSKSDIKIAVGLSGGVDSSVAALLLKKAGYDVFAIFMQNWHDTKGTLHGECEWEEEMNVAKMVAKKIDIPFYFVDLSDVYRKKVVDYMFSEYEMGRTPNPDVLCNREIKFDAFLKCAQEYGADFVATGHYCRKDIISSKNGEQIDTMDGGVPSLAAEDISKVSSSDYIYRIFEGSDPNKDQSYFLCQLTQRQLSKALFPIGDIVKSEVRRIAAEAQLPSAQKKDSQGICFVGKVDLPLFLQQKMASKQGQVIEIPSDFYDTLKEYPGYGTYNSINGVKLHGVRPEANGIPTSEVTFETGLSQLKKLSNIALEEQLHSLTRVFHYSPSDGKMVGTHFGAQFFTIGQRKGLNIGGHKESIFVISTDIQNNIIYVGEGHHHPGLLRKALKIDMKEIHWIREDLKMEKGDIRDSLVRIRYRQPLQKGVLFMMEDALYVVFHEHQRGISAGQFAAFYDDAMEMIGSGVIG
jgi:tRNA-uridine 2-sulfurtransferase